MRNKIALLFPLMLAMASPVSALKEGGAVKLSTGFGLGMRSKGGQEKKASLQILNGLNNIPLSLSFEWSWLLDQLWIGLEGGYTHAFGLSSKHTFKPEGKIGSHKSGSYTLNLLKAGEISTSYSLPHRLTFAVKAGGFIGEGSNGEGFLLCGGIGVDAFFGNVSIKYDQCKNKKFNIDKKSSVTGIAPKVLIEARFDMDDTYILFTQLSWTPMKVKISKKELGKEEPYKFFKESVESRVHCIDFKFGGGVTF